MKEIKGVRKSNKKDVKKARNSLTRVMQRLQIFAGNIEKDKDAPHHQTTSFFGPLTKAGKEDRNLGGDGAKAVFAMAKEIVAQQQAEDDDSDDSDVEMIIDGLIPMSDAGIMDYETPESPHNFKGGSLSSARSPRSRRTSTTRTSRTRTTTNRTTTTTTRTRTKRRTRTRTTATRTTRRTASEPGLVELSATSIMACSTRPRTAPVSKRYSRTPG